MKNNGSEGGREDVEPLAGSILLESRSDGGIGQGGGGGNRQDGEKTDAGPFRELKQQAWVMDLGLSAV